MIDHQTLPVYAQREKILQKLKDNQVIVVESPTGSGKTTQLPLILYEAGYARQGEIGVTQPRRIAAVSVCDYIAGQLGVNVSETVGYKMRFYDETGPDTRIKILTDGMLLQEMKLDPMLSEYSVIMVDEAHERSLNIDFILGLLKQIISERPEFKVIISSATINPHVFSEYFDACPIIHIDAEMYPVEVSYTPPKYGDEDSMYRKITELVEEHIESGRQGDILIFLSGEQQIRDCMHQLESSSSSRKMFLLPLFGRLSKQQQDRVFIPTPKGKTKVVVSTNIAETSITIEDITLVIDSGLAKLNYYNPKTYTSSLIEMPVSKASTNQRKGRAGRTAKGRCCRLYTKQEYEHRSRFTPEEIIRTDLSEVVLRMSELGIYDFEGFDFLTQPSLEGIQSAVETLKMLHAIDAEHRLTNVGEKMALFPLTPRHSRIIIESILSYPQVLEESITAVSFLSARSPFVLTPGREIESRQAHHRFSSPHGDFVSYLNLFRSYAKIQDREKRESFSHSHHLDFQVMEEILHIDTQLTEIVADQNIPVLSGGSLREYLSCISTGLIQFVCVRSGRETYRSMKADRIRIHPGSILFRESPEYIVAGELMKTSRMYARVVSPLKPKWLESIYPGILSTLGKKKAPAKGGKQKREVQTEKAKSEDKVFLWNRTFSLVPYRGKKKLVLLPLEDLRSIQPEYSRRGKNLRGKIVYRGMDIHPGDKINNLLRIYPFLQPEEGIYEGVPKGTFILPRDTEALLEHFYMLFQLCRIKKQSSLLGFISLETDSNHRYWFKVKRTLHSCVDSTFFSLEQIADEHLEEAGKVSSNQYNEAYRKAAELLDHL